MNSRVALHMCIADFNSVFMKSATDRVKVRSTIEGESIRVSLQRVSLQRVYFRFRLIILCVGSFSGHPWHPFWFQQA